MDERIAARTITGTVAGLYHAPGESFVTAAADRLTLTYEGIPGDIHAGLTRVSTSREPWYPRGTPMRNERQLSVLSVEELAEVAAAMDIPQLAPEWIGGNIALAGVPDLTRLPPRTLLMFPSGATVRIDGDNGPCRSSGRSIAAHFPDRPKLEFSFVQAAKYKRGLLGWVEREGEIRVGDEVSVRIWEQALYRAFEADR
ncbi:MAG TPA: MOSC domain-containing protein [Devosia sp.]|nr:MOSC domain-containing protein [Devosia sp.]